MWPSVMLRCCHIIPHADDACKDKALKQDHVLEAQAAIQS